MVRFDVSRSGAILAVSDFQRSLARYPDILGFEVDAHYDDPPYATLTRAGMGRDSPGRRLLRRLHERPSAIVRPAWVRRP